MLKRTPPIRLARSIDTSSKNRRLSLTRPYRLQNKRRGGLVSRCQSRMWPGMVETSDTFKRGSISRHVLEMVSTSALSLLALFLTDILTLI